jgi:hypothetical protein
MKTNNLVHLLAAVNLFVLLAAAVAVALIEDAARAAAVSASASYTIQHDQTQNNAALAAPRVRKVTLSL